MTLLMALTVMKYAPSEINNIAKFHNQKDLLNKLCQYSIYQIGLI